MALSLTAYQNQRFQWSQSVSAQAAQYAALGSASWRFQVRAFAGSPVVIFECVSGGSAQDSHQVATYDGTAHVVKFSAPTAAVARIPSGVYSFDYGFVLSGADFERVDGGTIEFDPGVTVAGVVGEPAAPTNSDDTVASSLAFTDDAGAVTAAAASALAAANSATSSSTSAAAAAASAASISASAVTSVMGRTGAVVGLEQTASKGVANGYAGLDGTGKVPSAQLPTAATITAASITDSTAAGRALLTAANVAAQKTALALVVADVSGAAPLASPALTGSPTAPTPTTSDNSTLIATTAFVKAQPSASGMVQIAQTVVSGTPTAVAFTSIPQIYSELWITCESVGLSISNNIVIELSANNGTTYAGSGGSGVSNTTQSGNIEFQGYTTNNGAMRTAFLAGALTTPSATTATAPGNLLTGHTGGANALRIRVGAGNFTSGTVTLYGKA